MLFRQAAAKRAAQSQAKHEGGDDDRHRLDVDAEITERRSLQVNWQIRAGKPEK
ncbi:MAG: hypothetical protein ACREC4_07200 [Methylocella sp.]